MPDEDPSAQRPRRPQGARRAVSNQHLFAVRAQQRRDREATAEPLAGEAGTGEAPEPRPDVRQMARAFLKPSASQAVLAAILLVFGVAVGAQVGHRTTDDPYTNARRADLVQLLDSANEETRKLDAELADLKVTRDQLQSGADRAKVAQVEAQKRLDNLSILAGTVAASGPGIRLVIFDPNSKVTAGMLLDAVEEFRDAGAEVIEINDSIRVVASTWFADGTQGLVADGKPVTRPIVFDVIGDAHALEEAARFRGGVVSQVQATQVGGSVTISSPTSVVVSSLHDVKANQYARPA